jgi:citrate lyase subunit beta/citryl-CoA lyase
MSSRVRRSLLIAPGNRMDLLEKLSRSPADVCVLELEDGVHPTLKDEARSIATGALRSLDWGPRERIVRVNRVATDVGAKDIHDVTAGAPDGVLLTKVEHEKEIRLAADILARAEEEFGVAHGTVKIWSMIETVQGLSRVEQICAADPRNSGVLFGAGDFGADLGVKRLGLGMFRRVPVPMHEYLYARGRVTLAARCAGIDSFDVGHSTFGDLEGTRYSAEIAAQMGFTGQIVYHPKQLGVVNEAFSPAPEDLTWAHEVIDRTAEAAADNTGARTVVVIDGEMIDGPFVINAEAILARQEAVGAFDASKAGQPVVDQ